MTLKSIRWIAAVAAVAGCSETPVSVMEPEVSRTILIEGNDEVSCTIDFISCYAILDAEIKALYEANNTAARRGEAEYRIVTNSNNELASIFNAETMTVADAVVHMDRFIAEIERAIAGGKYGECWGNYILEWANWLRATIAAESLDVSGRPVQDDCLVSPVTGTGTGSITAGVTLTLDDPFNFAGDPYGVYVTTTYFVVVGPNGTITTDEIVQSGAETVTITDASNKTPGTYTYTVQQCNEFGCSAATTITVVIPDATVSSCAHDNRNGNFTTPPSHPKCPKEDKIHKNK